MAIWARAMLLAAAADGYTLQVGSGEEMDYKGTSAEKAWEAVTQVEMASVYLRKDGAKSEVATVIPHGVGPEETLADFSTGGFIEAWFDAKFAAEG